MATITQDMRYRLSLINYAEKYGVTNAAVKYKTNRQYIYRWKRHYDGSLESLRDHSRRPHHHPNQHTPEEIKLILNMRRRNPDADLVIFWVKLMQRGYTRSITGLYRFLRRQGIMAVKPANPKYVAKPYEQMQYPGQRIQVDVKFVPSVCLVNEAKGKNFISIPLLMNTPDGALLKPSKNTVLILRQYFLTIWLKPFPARSNAFRLTTGKNLPNVSVLMVGPKSLLFFRSGFQSTESGTS